VALGAAGVEADLEGGTRPPCQQISTAARWATASTVTTTSSMRLPSSSLRSRAVVVSAPRAVGLERGTLDREPLTLKALVVPGLKLADRLRGRPEGGGGDGLEEARRRLVESVTAERLTRLAGGMQVASAHARIAADLMPAATRERC
jgi:hypothetical protein